MLDKRPHPAPAAGLRPGRGQFPPQVFSPAAGDLTVVGIGAAAGGLEACRQLLAALPAASGMGFLLVQHSDPTGDSRMVEVLAAGTPLMVRQASDGMPIERDHLYVIPPGTYPSVAGGVLHLSGPPARHAARLPFDFLLHALAGEYGTRAVCLILSGTGADGSLGLKSVKEHGGLVIAQAPDEAGFDGMPRSAILTGGVDFVLPVAEIPAALARYDRRIAGAPAILPGDGGRSRAMPGTRQAALAELCRGLVLQHHAPAAVLINRQHECLFSLGPMEHYLRLAPANPPHDLLDLVRPGLRSRLAVAIEQAGETNARIVTAGGRLTGNDQTVAFNIDVQPVVSQGEQLWLVCFADAPRHQPAGLPPVAPQEKTRVAALGQELAATRAELHGAIRTLEMSIGEQRSVNEETESFNEEYQATNEELLTSKEELQSLNEEMATLNAQLQETLERQRTTANDLQNVLYSTNVATLFLDPGFNIRFFTPATRRLFRVIPGDVGRPLADLTSLAADGNLPADARTVLQTLAPHEREVEVRQDGGETTWYLRRILPYRTRDNGVEGFVITFADITGRKQAADALEVAKRLAEQANTAKSRFLAAASHDLRQPLQTLTLLQGMLANTVTGERARKLVVHLDKTLGAMSLMLNSLLDFNQIEAGAVHPEKTSFLINELLLRLGDEFAGHAEAGGITLRVVPCSLAVHSDPRLLEQMLRNLLSNALKYTRQGGVLLGCRRHDARLAIEIWDTGAGIAAEELDAIFAGHGQPAADAPGRRLGLGLSIVQRLAILLGHRVRVRSRPGRGSVFAVEVALLPGGAAALPDPQPPAAASGSAAAVRPTGVILVVEDDPEMSVILELFLKEEGHRVVTAPDGAAALDLVVRGALLPDLILADDNPPKGMNGLQIAATLREKLHHVLPAVILTGDTVSESRRDIAPQKCVQLTKPVRLKNLTEVIGRLLPAAQPGPHLPRQAAAGGHAPPVIYLVDDDDDLRDGLRAVLEENGLTVEDYPSCEGFLAAWRPGREACLLIDAYLPGMSGLELLQHLEDGGHRLAAIMLTGNSDVPMAVQAMKAGALDFIEKPVSRAELLASVGHALTVARDSGVLTARREEAAAHVASLTPRQQEIMERVLAGQPSKNIAADLGISQRTVENHRAAIMRKTGSKSLPALARLALAAAANGDEPPDPNGSSATG